MLNSLVIVLASIAQNPPMAIEISTPDYIPGTCHPGGVGEYPFSPPVFLVNGKPERYYPDGSRQRYFIWLNQIVAQTPPWFPPEKQVPPLTAIP